MYLYLKQKVFSIGEKFTFYDANQNVIYRAEGSLFSIPKRFTLLGHGGPELTVERKVFSWMPQYKFIDMPANREFATMKQKFAFTKKFEIHTTNGNFRIEGSLYGYNFRIINEQGTVVAHVDKHYISWGDTYEINIDERLIWPKLACGIMVAYDNAVHNNNN